MHFTVCVLGCEEKSCIVCVVDCGWVAHYYYYYFLVMVCCLAPSWPRSLPDGWSEWWWYLLCWSVMVNYSILLLLCVVLLCLARMHILVVGVMVVDPTIFWVDFLICVVAWFIVVWWIKAGANSQRLFEFVAWWWAAWWCGLRGFIHFLVWLVTVALVIILCVCVSQCDAIHDGVQWEWVFELVALLAWHFLAVAACKVTCLS